MQPGQVDTCEKNAINRIKNNMIPFFLKCRVTLSDHCAHANALFLIHDLCSLAEEGDLALKTSEIQQRNEFEALQERPFRWYH